MRSEALQANLKIGQPGNVYEQAAESSRAMNVKAYTLGQDVVFGAGQYTPGTAEGRKLMAHELTHVVQQSGKK